MKNSDAYTEEEAKSLVGRQVSQVNPGQPARFGDVIAHDHVEVVRGESEHCIWVQWDGSDKVVLFGKLNEGQDFKVDKAMENRKAKKHHSPYQMPPSQMQIDALKKMLSKPDTSLAPSPMGTVTGSYNPERNRQVMAHIRSAKAKLADRKDQARTAFNHASENSLSNIFHNARGMHM